jgi:hypothetical protein
MFDILTVFRLVLRLLIAYKTCPSGTYQIFLYVFNYFKLLRECIQNIPDWFRHLHSGFGSAKQRYNVGLRFLVSQCARLHVAGWTWAVFTRV